MINEDRARELLRSAGDTVLVTPGVAPIDAPRRLPLLVAAVLAVLMTAGAVGWVATRNSGADQHPTGQPHPVLTNGPGAYRLDADQVPLLFGYTVSSAQRELEEHGWAVKIRRTQELDCRSPDRLWDTDPSVGTHLRHGATVTIVAPAPNDCVSADETTAWRLIDFAEGRRPLPPTSAELTIWLGNRFSKTLTSDEAADPDNWVVCSTNGVVCASPLADLVAAKYEMDNTSPDQPYLHQSRGDTPDPTCQSPIAKSRDPVPLLGQSRIIIGIEAPTMGAWCTNTNEVFDDEGVISAVTTWTGLNRDGSAGLAVPDVRGSTGGEADSRLDTARLSKRSIERTDDCPHPGLVVAQSPAPGALLSYLGTVELTLCKLSSLRPDPDRVGATFVSFAWGESPNGIKFADSVDLYVGNRRVRSITAEQARDRASWSVCPSGGYAEGSCPFSALDTIRRTKSPAIATAEHPALGACATGEQGADLPTGRFVVLGVAEPDSCMSNWDVEIYYDDDLRVTAVNLLLGSP
jgi:hypothetical protein